MTLEFFIRLRKVDVISLVLLLSLRARTLIKNISTLNQLAFRIVME